jgi:hypothetical protein
MYIKHAGLTAINLYLCRMLVVGDVLVSEELLETHFVCDLASCKGQCCVSGDAGAPLNEEEASLLEEELEQISPFLSQEGLEALKPEGPYTFDPDGDLVTPLVKGRQCAYTVFESNGTASCGIEKAWKAGKTPFRKPVSCHLYPIRVLQLPGMEALNYHNWDICKPACKCGESLQVPVYRFLKDALVRKYGSAWYDLLEESAQAWLQARVT